MDCHQEMKHAKHILIITPGFPSDENDDSCIPPLQDFLKGFINSSPSTKITIFTLHYPFKTIKYSWNGIPVHPYSGRDNRIKKPFLWNKIIKDSRILNEQTKIDLIHSFWFGECAMLGNILSNKFSCEHICTLMGQDAVKPNLYQMLLKNAKMKIIAISGNQADEFLKRTNKKADYIIHWGIEEQNFEIVNRDIDLLAVGSLIPLKNYSLLINILEDIKILKPDIKCILAGTGPEEAKLKALVKQKSLDNNISFTGLINHKDIIKLMQRSNIFIHPSTFEGFGYVFAEALSSGMSIVSFNVGAADYNPKWFIAKNEMEFTSTVKNLITSKLDFTPFNLFPLKETIRQYAFIYGIQ
jgi:glycosyltransferase involved in cell wall biosynthesis